MPELRQNPENGGVQQAEEERMSFSLVKFIAIGFAGAGVALVVSIVIALIFRSLFDMDNMGVRLVIFTPAGFAISGGAYLSKLKSAKAISMKNIIIAVVIAAAVGLLAGLMGQSVAHPNARDMWPLISMLGVPLIMALQLFSN